MLKILKKYLVTETAYAIITVLVILLIILSSNTMMRLIEEAAEGNFPTYLLFPTIIIKIAQYLIYLIPISLFFGIILAFGRLYNTNEMAVISSAGISPIDLAKLLLPVIVVVSLIVALFTLYLTPLTSEYRSKLEHRLKNEERVEEVTPGKFNSSSSGSSTFFVHDIIGGKLNKIFFSSKNTKHGSTETATSAKYFYDEKDNKFLQLEDGEIYQLIGDQGATRKTKYKEHAVQLEQILPNYKSDRSSTKSTIELFFGESYEDSAELQSRFLLPLASLLLGFIAIPISYCAPKKGRYEKIFLGAVLYFFYFVGMAVVKKMYILNYTPNFFGIWWIHIFAILFLVYLYHIDSTSIRDRN